jgi:hypothetical protein
MSEVRPMSSPKTKIFGMTIGIDPKIIVGALLVVAGLVYYFNSQGDDRPPAAASVPAAAVDVNAAHAPGVPAVSRSAAMRRTENARSSARVGLKLVPIDGSRGDVDPTLRLQLLERVRNVSPVAGLRNIFEGPGQAVPVNLPPIPKTVKMPPKPLTEIAKNTPQPLPPAPPPFSIPLKYYGFAKPSGKAPDGNRGLFLDGDNILMGGEGDVLEKRYLIVALTPNSARLEDTQMKQGQDVPVTPAAQ